eukprot:c9785_g1_i2.p1 GENE.c9785_g1_i2~~c9785_g1_i2.p1  ORF type:complete len:267 (+),score=57.69 c9785_g1_i2:111-803(+)
MAFPNRGHLGDGRQETEWDALQKRIGAFKDQDGATVISEEGLNQLVDEVMEKVDPMEHKTIEQLHTLEDDIDDDVLAAYRNKRMAELKAQVARNKFGDLVQISAQDWKREVTDVVGFDVVVLLWLSGIPQANLMSSIFRQLARKFKDVKFVQIKATDAIPKFPEHQCPTILVYRTGNIIQQWVCLTPFNGDDTTADDVEWELAEAGVLKTDMQEEPHHKRQQGSISFNIR